MDELEPTRASFPSDAHPSQPTPMERALLAALHSLAVGAALNNELLVVARERGDEVSEAEFQDAAKVWAHAAELMSRLTIRSERQPAFTEAVPETTLHGDPADRSTEQVSLGVLPVRDLLTILTQDHGLSLDRAERELGMEMLVSGYPSTALEVVAADAIEIIANILGLARS